VKSHGPFRADGLDLQILHALQVNGRAGFGLMGRVLKVSDQTVIRRYAKLRSAAGLRVVGTADELALGQRRWYVRVRTTPDAATAISQAIARHPDTAWVRLVSGGTEIICSVRAGDAAGGHALLLDKLPRISRVLDVRAQSELHVTPATPTGCSRWSAPWTQTSYVPCARRTRPYRHPTRQPETARSGFGWTTPTSRC